MRHRPHYIPIANDSHLQDRSLRYKKIDANDYHLHPPVANGS